MKILPKIVEGLDFQPYQYVLEVYPGTGVLTKYLLENLRKLTLQK